MNRIPNDKYVVFYSFNTALASAYYVPGTFILLLYSGIRADRKAGQQEVSRQCDN